MNYLRDRRKVLGGSLPQRIAKAPLARSAGTLEAFDSLLQSSGDREFSTTMALVRILQHAGEGQEHRQARRADRPGRGAHLRHGRHVPPGRHLFFDGPAVHAAGRGSADVLQAKTRRDRSSKRASTKAVPSVLVHRRGNGVLRITWRQHGAVLHLLLDVRLPARRRLHLGGRRQSGARLPRGRHCRTHDACRRRPCSTRTGTVTCVSTTVPNCVVLRSRVRVSSSRSSCRTVCVACSRSSGRRLLSISPCMNENYAHPAMPKGAEQGILQGHVPVAARAVAAKCV